jgi:SAM-dependent methyltransferase
MAADALPDGERYDVVCAFEVLEHLEDDVAGLRSWLKHLRPGGFLVLSVPAFQSRFASADRQVGHYRRYDPKLLRRQLEGAGLTNVEVWITGFPFGLVLEHGRNLLATIRPKTGGMETRTQESGRWQQPPAALGWATAVITLPFRWVQRLFLRTRLGTGIVACARLPT